MALDLLVNTGQVMACCLTAPSHYLNQGWLIISKFQRHSSEGNFKINTSAINHWNYLENYLSKISFKSPRGQWVKAIASWGESTVNRQWIPLTKGQCCGKRFHAMTLSCCVPAWATTMVLSRVLQSDDRPDLVIKQCGAGYRSLLITDCYQTWQAICHEPMTC